MGPWITLLEVVRWGLIAGIALFSTCLATVLVRGPCRARQHNGKYLVGVVGKARHGKDSVGNILLEHGFMKEAFAKPVKDAAKAIWGFTDDQLYGEESVKNAMDPRWNISPRMAMQFLGTEFGRDLLPKLTPQFGSGFWVEHFRQRYEKYLQDHKSNPANCTSNLVVCDVRFPNEAKLIKDLNGLVVRVKRPSLENKEPPNANAAIAAPTTEQLKTTAAAAGERKEEPNTSVEQPQHGHERIGVEKKGEEDPKAVKFNGDHRSEKLMDEIAEDVLIVNDGTLEDLRRKVLDNVLPMIPLVQKRKAKRTPKAE